MKIINKIYIILIVTVVLISGCVEMDLDPQGGTVSDSQKENLIEMSPDRLSAEVNGLYSGLTIYRAIGAWYGGTAHFDFGYPAAMMMFDASGQDVPSEDTGYNWFRNQLRMTDRVFTSSGCYFIWNLFYSHLKTANDIIKIIPADTNTEALKNFRGQALASRAFDYLHLVQAFQFTYKGHENDPSVPIVTDETSDEIIADNPRASVTAVYDQIIKDLNEAIQLLESVSTTRANKGVIDVNVAYGLRARANLLMQNWSAAAADAEKAVAGFTPYTIAQVSIPAFNNGEASSWIWGVMIAETNDVVKSGLLNFPSHMCSFTGNGYSPGYAGRYINSELFKQIPATDVRKGWWLDQDEFSPNVNFDWRAEYNGVLYGPADWFGWSPYLNVKFGPYKDIYDNPTNACDVPLMRVEEMILIRAEALAMGGNPAGGKQVLENFIKTYRDPSYVCPASDAQGIQDEVWFQRRIELWGEGFSLFDLLRLKKPLMRKGTNYPAAAAFNLPAEAQNLIWLIPEDEINANNGISIKDNNPTPTVPTP